MKKYSFEIILNLTLITVSYWFLYTVIVVGLRDTNGIWYLSLLQFVGVALVAIVFVLTVSGFLYSLYVLYLTRKKKTQVTNNIYIKDEPDEDYKPMEVNGVVYNLHHGEDDSVKKENKKGRKINMANLVNNELVDRWNIEDIKSAIYEDDDEVSDAVALEVMKKVVDEFDCNYGVTNQVINDAYREVKEKLIRLD